MTKVRKVIRSVALGTLTLCLGSAAFFAYQWYRTVPLEEISIDGNSNAEYEALVALAALDTVAFVVEVDTRIVADRVRRHPWVRAASATRWPTGTLEITVEERVPVLLALDRSGRPVHYLDAEGFALPLVPNVHFNVPLLKGAGSVGHPLRPVQDDRIRSLAADVSLLDEREQALLSEFELREREVWLRTSATTSGQSIEVRLGRDGFEEKLRRLHAFWHQAVLTQPDTRFERVDLRFDSQVVTRENHSGETRPDRIANATPPGAAIE